MADCKLKLKADCLYNYDVEPRKLCSCGQEHSLGVGVYTIKLFIFDLLSLFLLIKLLQILQEIILSLDYLDSEK